MKKKIIELSKWHVVALVILGVGILLLLTGVGSWLKLRAALNISRLETEDLRLGRYVKGEITQCAGKNVETVNGMEFHMVSQSVGYGFTWNSFYDTYTIPLSDETYVRVLIKDEMLLDTLNSYDAGVGKGAFFVGKVEKPRYDIDYEFWEDSDVFGSIDEAKEKICDKYVLREIYPERIRYKLYAGLSLIITSMLIVIACGRIKVKESRS